MQILNVFQICHHLTSGHWNAVHDIALFVSSKDSKLEPGTKQGGFRDELYSCTRLISIGLHCQTI